MKRTCSTCGERRAESLMTKLHTQTDEWWICGDIASCFARNRAKHHEMVMLEKRLATVIVKLTKQTLAHLTWRKSALDLARLYGKLRCANTSTKAAGIEAKMDALVNAQYKFGNTPGHGPRKE